MDPKSFVLDVAEVDRERLDHIDVYRLPNTPSSERRPLIVFVHGGPMPPNIQPGPRDWPVFVGYGSLAADHGMVGVTLEHHFYSGADCASAADEIAAAVAQARALPGVDPDRVAMWFFSGGGILANDWLLDPPLWLRCLALTYPVVVPPAEWGIDERFRPVVAAESAGELPILLTRVGLESAEFASGVEAFVSVAGTHNLNLEIVDVPDGRHGYDMLDHTDASRAAVISAMAWVVGNLSPVRQVPLGQATPIR